MISCCMAAVHARAQREVHPCLRCFADVDDARNGADDVLHPCDHVSPAAWLASWRRLVKQGKVSFSTVSSSSGGKNKATSRYVLNDLNEVCEPQALSSDKDAPVGRYSAVGRFFIVLRAQPAHSAGALLLQSTEHDEATCPMCAAGPHRFSHRPLIARAMLRSSRVWEVRAVHVDPVEPAGHMLLVPDPEIGEPRAQRLTPNDCTDLVEIGRSCGRSICVAFNSLRAGAAHNHLHLVAWATGNRMYGIATAQAIPDSTRICLGSVELSALEWPAACIRLRGGSAEQCGRVVCALCAAVATHSVVVLGFSTYVFLRSDHGEESEAIPGLCLAAHHLLGHFVVESPEQFMAASGASGDAGDAVVAQCLRDTRGGARVANGSSSAQAHPQDVVEPPAALLARLFEFGGRLMFY